MIVACPSCSARFKVADEKIGLQGAKVRCSKCQKVFGVHREAAPPLPSPAFPRAVPASPDLDLEPARAPASSFGAIAQPEDPFAPRAASAPSFAADPLPVDDPFAPYHQAAAAAPPTPTPPPAPSLSPPRPPPLARPAALAAPSFDQARTADLLAGFAPAPDPASPPFDDGLSLEEPVVRPSRPSAPSVPSDGWLGEFHGGELEGRPGDAPSFPDVIPDAPGTFGTAFSAQASESISIRTGTVAEAPAAPRTPLEEVTARRRAAVAAGGGAGQATGAGRATRLRVALVDAFALAVLLLAALALAVFWRGGLTPAEALRPSNLLAALTGRAAEAGPFETSEIESAFYERRRGPPLLFVRGVVTTRAGAPAGPVRVSVDVVRDDRVLAHLEGRAGGALGPEALAEVEDAASLARLVQAAGAAAPVTFSTGERLPFLVALADVPPGLEGAALRVTADAEVGR